MDKETSLTFHVRIAGDRVDALDKRDEIIHALSLMGFQVSLIDCGTLIYIVDSGIPTIGDKLTG